MQGLLPDSANVAKRRRRRLVQPSRKCSSRRETWSVELGILRKNETSIEARETGSGMWYLELLRQDT
jgi:hypothetical protein